MDSEPRGHTIDGTPWEEPRPPHLPDRLTSISPWVLPFVVVLVVQLWLLWLNQPFSTDPRSPGEYWLDTRYQFTELAGSLIGLALFLRHPDARRTLPQVAWGVFLLLLAQVMGVIELTLDPVFSAFAPPNEDLFWFSPLKDVYSIFTSLVAVFGIAFIASGLSTARRYDSTGPGGGLAGALLIFAVVSTAVSGASAVLQLTTAEFDVPLALVGTVIGSLVAWFLRRLALAYLVVVAVGGWLGQEAPRLAWRLATVGAGLLLLQGLVGPLFAVVPLPQDSLLAIGSLIGEGVVIGWVLLVIAFGLGLPSTESIAGDETARAMPIGPAVTTPGSGGG